MRPQQGRDGEGDGQSVVHTGIVARRYRPSGRAGMIAVMIDRRQRRPTRRAGDRGSASSVGTRESSASTSVDRHCRRDARSLPLRLLASGPWEWDETIFARGMLDFSLAAHFPQPPGFPGLLALGHLLLPLAGTPYAALQLVSAMASVLALWPLAALGRRVAPPAVATAAALLVLFLPGPWLFSVRGFLDPWPR